MVKTVFKRAEIKYILDYKQFIYLSEFLSERMKYDEYCINGDTYSIYNIYFDTKNDDIIQKSISKPYYKEKLRLRSYCIPNEDDTVFLELKKKINKTVSKRRLIMKYKEALEFLDSKEYKESNNVIDEIKYHMYRYKLFPRVFIRYDRLAFFDKENEDFRVSFDMNIRSRRYDLKLDKGGYGCLLLDDKKILMEVKCLGAMPLWFSKKLSELKIYSRSFSKYGNEYKKQVENLEKEKEFINRYKKKIYFNNDLSNIENNIRRKQCPIYY